jgi:hypothetical protein
VLEAPFVPQLADDLEQGFVAPIARKAAADALAGDAFAPPPAPLPDLPPARQVSADRLLPADISERDAGDAFLAEFGATVEHPAVIDDHAGGRLVIAPEMFRDAAGRLSLGRDLDRRHLLLLADLLRAPDEVWVALEVDAAGRLVVRRRALARFAVEGQDAPGVATVEWDSRQSWMGRTAFAPEAAGEIEHRARSGVRLYSRLG